jgi:hypothetical protein
MIRREKDISSGGSVRLSKGNQNKKPPIVIGKIE